jgi:hypothetical protein
MYGTNKRKTFIDEAYQSCNPSPGTHDPTLDLKYKSTNSYKFSASNRKDLDDN